MVPVVLLLVEAAVVVKVRTLQTFFSTAESASQWQDRGIAEAKVAAYLHPVSFQRPLVAMRGLSTEETCLL